MEIEILAKKDWSYSIEKRDDQYFISVICGGAGLFEKDVEISKFKAEELLKDEAAANRVAEAIRLNPNSDHTVC